MSLAPVALFVYNRPDHTKQTLSALLANPEAIATDLFVFSDGPKVPAHQEGVAQVRALFQDLSGFRSVTLVEREQNWGLAKSIITGVSEVVEQYGTVIVIEDDILTSPGFLEYMNRALKRYEYEPKVWHVSGWSYPISACDQSDAFFWRGMNCWGWATWSDRWKFYSKDPGALISDFNRRQRRDFDLNGTKVFWPQVEHNYSGKINTWAIFWYATIYRFGGLCLNPAQSFVRNIGHDGSGVHCGDAEVDQHQVLNTRGDLRLPDLVEENSTAVVAIESYYRAQRRPLWVRVLNKLCRMLGGRNIL